jgi:hypothetical protein
MQGIIIVMVAGVGVGLLVRYQLRLSAVPANALLLRDLWRGMGQSSPSDYCDDGKKTENHPHTKDTGPV